MSLIATIFTKEPQMGIICVCCLKNYLRGRERDSWKTQAFTCQFTPQTPAHNSPAVPVWNWNQNSTQIFCEACGNPVTGATNTALQSLRYQEAKVRSQSPHSDPRAVMGGAVTERPNTHSHNVLLDGDNLTHEVDALNSLRLQDEEENKEEEIYKNLK